jgi:hypothetical protein
LELQEKERSYYESRGNMQGWAMKAGILKDRLAAETGGSAAAPARQEQHLTRAMEHNEKLADVVKSLQTRLEHSRQMSVVRGASHRAAMADKRKQEELKAEAEERFQTTLEKVSQLRRAHTSLVIGLVAVLLRYILAPPPPPPPPRSHTHAHTHTYSTKPKSTESTHPYTPKLNPLSCCLFGSKVRELEQEERRISDK